MASQSLIMNTYAQKRWFESCLKNWNQRKEEELAKAWTKTILLGGTVVLSLIFTIKWAIG